MNAILIAIGDELVSGQTVDTNSPYLAIELARLGVATTAHWVVADSQPAITDAISRAADQADVVIVGGGLGPTADDVTRESLAETLGRPLVEDAASLQQIEEFFRTRERIMRPSNRQQAMLPQNAEAMPNKVGTAPGIIATLGKARVFVVPGVPSEMRWMFQTHVAPRLAGKAGSTCFHIIHTFGQGESDIGEKIADLMQRGREPAVGTTVAAGLVSVRIVAHGENAQDAVHKAATVAGEIRNRLGEFVVGEGQETLASVVGQLLRQRGQTVATAESCTGGLIGKLFTDSPGASHYYVGGVVAYANRAKQNALGVPAELLKKHGAVSEPVAHAMAAGCRERFGADWAISVTGIAGPDGGTADKPVGLVYAGLAGPLDSTQSQPRDAAHAPADDGKDAATGVQVHRHLLPGLREVVRLRAALNAMNHLRLALLRNTK